MERSLNRNEIGCRRLNGRSKEKYPRKQPSDLINVVTSKKGVIVDLEYECAIAGLLSLIKSKKSDFFINLVWERIVDVYLGKIFFWNNRRLSAFQLKVGPMTFDFD